VANSLRLLGLPESVRDYLIQGLLTAGHAKILAALSQEEAEELAEIIVKHEYSVREAEELVRQSKAGNTIKPSKPAVRDDALVRDLVGRLQTVLGTKVKIKDKNGKGRIEIHYANVDVLQSVLDRLIEEE
jgi:ParB family chromosome partitioning protein